MDGGGEFGVARVNQRPGTLAAEPAMPARKLPKVARIEAPPHCRRAVSPGVDQESLQHAAE